MRRETRRTQELADTGWGPRLRRRSCKGGCSSTVSEEGRSFTTPRERVVVWGTPTDLGHVIAAWLTAATLSSRSFSGASLGRGRRNGRSLDGESIQASVLCLRPISALVDGTYVGWEWVRGHDARPLSERVDRLARFAAERSRVLAQTGDIPLASADRLRLHRTG